MNRFTKRALTIGAVVVITGTAGGAWAAWSSTGAGSGSATSTTSAPSTITPDTAAAGLYPGATSSLKVTFNNPNSYPVTVTSIAAGSSDLTSGNCAAGTVTTEAVTNPSGTIGVGATGTYTLVTHFATNPDDNCKSQSFTIPLTATLASAA